MGKGGRSIFDKEGNPGCGGTALWGTGSHPWEAD